MDNQFLDLPARATKPRSRGLTSVVDNGHSLARLDQNLVDTESMIDIIKLGWASAYITPRLDEKISLIRRHDIRCCPGGMFFELSYLQGKIDAFAQFVETHGFEIVEVPNGSLPIPEADKCRMIEWFARRGFTVLSEVGSKDITVTSPPESWVQSIRDDLNAGAWKVITEGRADASAGIYNSDGSMRLEIIDAILGSGIPVDDLIFEAPHKRQMSWFIHRVGTDVNIGNVPLNEVTNLETLRLGLRGDTVKHFHLDQHPEAVHA